MVQWVRVIHHDNAGEGPGPTARIALIGWALRSPGGLEECGEPRRNQPDPFPPRHLRRQRRGAARRHHQLRPGRHVRPARRALEPPGPGPVRPRAALRGPRGRAAAQRRPDPRGGVRPAALRSLLHHGQHAPGRRRGGLHRGRLRRSHAHHLGCAGTPGGRAGRPHTGRGPPAHDRTDRRRRPHVLRRVRRRFARGAAWPKRSRAPPCSTPRAPPATPRGSDGRSPGSPSAPMSSCPACWAGSWASAPGTCTSLRRRSTTPPRSCGP